MSTRLLMALLALAVAAAGSAIEAGPWQLWWPITFAALLVYLAAWRHPRWMPAVLLWLDLGASALLGMALSDPLSQPRHAWLALVLVLWLPVHFGADALARAGASDESPVAWLPGLALPREVLACTIHRCALAAAAASFGPILCGAGPVYALAALAGGLVLVGHTQDLAARAHRRHANAAVVASLVQLGALIVGVAL